MERDGAKFLFLQMGFDSSQESDRLGRQGHHGPPGQQRDLLHPRVFASRGGRPNPDNGRSTAQGGLLFDRLDEPHANVVLVFSGHLHGVRQRITEREDGTRDALYTCLYQFDLDSGKVAANAYSPRLQSFRTVEERPARSGLHPGIRRVRLRRRPNLTPWAGSGSY
ncbi:hypothetical protein ACKFRZ_03815 [Corynebacterium gottingense]|uniref:hypothetical protein n=1 Tax=Corynebacterium gottingense TaxID=2041036 RepID=UPI0038D1CC74